MDVRFLPSVDGIEAADLAGFGDVLYTKGFLQFAEAEQRGRVEPHHLTLVRDGRLAGFAPVFRQREPIPFTFNPGDYLGHEAEPLPGHGLSVSDALMLYTPFRLRSDVKVHGAVAREPLLEAVVHHARRLGCAVVVLPFVSETNTALRHALAATGFVECFHEADFHFDTAFATYEGFVASLPAGVRKQYRADRAAMEEAGVRIHEVADIASMAGTVAGLHGRLMRKYGHSRLELSGQTLPRLAALVEGVSLFVAVRGGQVVGYVLNVHDAHTFHCLRCGQAYEALERANVYFNLVFATSARKAIELGCRHVSFGKAGHRGKLLRGCRYTRGLACFRFVDPAVHEAMRPVLRRVNDRKLAAFDAAVRLR